MALLNILTQVGSIVSDDFSDGAENAFTEGIAVWQQADDLCHFGHQHKDWAVICWVSQLADVVPLLINP
jgi:hypothetical protein